MMHAIPQKYTPQYLSYILLTHTHLRLCCTLSNCFVSKRLARIVVSCSSSLVLMRVYKSRRLLVMGQIILFLEESAV